MEKRAMTMSRRRFVDLTGGAAATLALLGPSRAFANASDGPYGPLVPDPGGVLDLPPGFQYRILSQEGSPTMRNLATKGIPVPGSHDGMAAFAGPGNTTVLVRNHEQAGSAGPPVVGTNPYTLQALVIDGASRNADLYNPGQQFVVRWVTVNPAEPHDDTLGKGAVRFTQLEGSNFAGGAFWFDDTQGGEARRGQIYRLIGMTPEGQTYTFARNRLPGEAEFAGPTFAPDGQTFFVNVQDPGTTLAIWGPFARQNRERQRVMARAAPANEYSPKISGELAEAAQRYGLSHLEAAAYERLGVPLV
jgi:secreted PhoX family phosphatase